MPSRRGPGSCRRGHVVGVRSSRLVGQGQVVGVRSLRSGRCGQVAGVSWIAFGVVVPCMAYCVCGR